MDCLNRHRPVLRKAVTVLNLGSICFGASAGSMSAGLMKDAPSQGNRKRRDRQTHNQIAPGEPAQTSPPGYTRT